jgi:cytidylate kinase
LTWKALEEGVDVHDAKALNDLALRAKWEFKTSEDGVIIRTWIDGQGVTQQIREERVSKNSSIVAGAPGVRKHLRMLQRRLGRNGKIVMEGRDITTNVFPNADYKIYLDGSIEERALRRTKQLRGQGKRVSLEKIKKAIIERDMGDLKRRINPLRQAKDAIVIDSTNLKMQEVADRILKLIHQRENG